MTHPFDEIVKDKETQTLFDDVDRIVLSVSTTLDILKAGGDIAPKYEAILTLAKALQTLRPSTDYPNPKQETGAFRPTLEYQKWYEETYGTPWGTSPRVVSSDPSPDLEKQLELPTLPYLPPTKSEEELLEHLRSNKLSAEKLTNVLSISARNPSLPWSVQHLQEET